jgi:hypothetical protein
MFRGADAMTASPNDDTRSALRSGVDDLGVWLAVWEHCQEPDAHARRCASDVADAIDNMLRDLGVASSRPKSKVINFWKLIASF